MSDVELRDDGLHSMLAQFDYNVRVLILSDSCRSGGLRFAEARDWLTVQERRDWQQQREQAITRQMRSGWNPPEKMRPILLPREQESVQLRASVLLFAACGDGENARDAQRSSENSLFTSCLLDVWAGGAFPRSNVDFFLAVYRRVSNENARQHPGVAFYGSPAPSLLNERPFEKRPSVRLDLDTIR
jgi:hypothetical protein